MSRLRIFLGAVFVLTLICLGLSVTFTIMDLRESTLEVRIAKDDITWPAHQIEVEAYQTLSTVLRARQTPEILPHLDLRYALLLSRTDLFKHGEFLDAIYQLPKSQKLLQNIIRQAENLDPLVNRAMSGEPNSLDQLEKALETLLDRSHQLTLQINYDKIEQIVSNRKQLSAVFLSTEILLGVLALLSLLGFIFLYLMIERAEKNRAEAEFHRRRAEANSEAKSRFLSNMSHELRTPLNAIMGFAQLIKMEDENLSREHLDNVIEIYTASEHLLSLINDILDLSKIESGQLGISMEPCSVMTVINECFKLVNRLAYEKNISLHAPVTRFDYLMEVDHTRLKQVLTNLLTNAIKYNRKDGWVKIELRRRERDNHLRIEVIDNGIGIRKQDQSKVFQPFERLADDVTIEGTGIGLALCQQLVMLMGGEIGFKSTEDEGSRFWVDFPVKEVLAPENVDRKPISIEPLPDAKTLLYIDDNQTNLKLLEQYLSSFPGLKLLTATDADQGLEVAAQTLPDIILLDLNLPRVTGYEVYRRLKSQPYLVDTPVVVVTANINAQIEAESLGIQFDRILMKPIDFNELERVLDSELDMQTAKSAFL
ncbi:hybrid sensor histidine kinase/response regulator [Hahella sp. CCB-MM4]|nr:hybrid sensor histidine kinase/response regulator [Hahella sp. CCB-MM4]